MAAAAAMAGGTGGGAGRVLVPLLKPEALAWFVAHGRKNGPVCLLGLDVGGSKVGLALADRTLAFARPLGRIDRRGDRPFAEFPAQVARRLRLLAAEHRVGGLVVGYPLELWTGQAGKRCREVFAFMERVYQHAAADEEESRRAGGDSGGGGGSGSSSEEDHQPAFPAPLPPFALWDERMTTQEARAALAGAGRMRKGRQAAAEDGVAATLILQGFLDAHMLVGPAAEQQ